MTQEVNITRKKPIYLLHFDLGIDLNYDLEDDLEFPEYYYKWIFQSKTHAKEVIHMFLALLVKNDIFACVTLKSTFWP